MLPSFLTTTWGLTYPAQLIAEKIKSAQANIPEGFGTPEMGPITTGLGEIYQYILDVKPGYEDHYSPMELRTIQDWVVKRQLAGIPVVVEVNTWGGYLKQYEVAINPERLKSFNITLLEVYNAVAGNNSLAGGAYIEKQNLTYFIRGDGMVKSLDEIGEIVVKTVDDKPILVRDLAEVHFGHANRFGAITANREGEKVMGQIMMLKGANSKKVINAVKERVTEVQKSLPEGIFINPIIERSELIGKTTNTIVENLLLGCIIVIFVVILLLGNVRSGVKRCGRQDVPPDGSLVQLCHYRRHDLRAHVGSCGFSPVFAPCKTKEKKHLKMDHGQGLCLLLSRDQTLLQL